jgi:hypothetical protein
LPKEGARLATSALPNSSVLVDLMWSDFADRCKIKGTMRLLIPSKQTNGGSVLLAAELWKRVADNRAGLAARSQPAARKLKTTVKKGEGDRASE